MKKISRISAYSLALACALSMAIPAAYGMKTDAPAQVKPDMATRAWSIFTRPFTAAHNAAANYLSETLICIIYNHCYPTPPKPLTPEEIETQINKCLDTESNQRKRINVEYDNILFDPFALEDKQQTTRTTLACDSLNFLERIRQQSKTTPDSLLKKVAPIVGENTWLAPSPFSPPTSPTWSQCRSLNTERKSPNTGNT